jgi:DNA-binding response OmpR family regulator
LSLRPRRGGTGRPSPERWKARILVIEDNEELLTLYAAVLEWNGYQAVTMGEPPSELGPIRDAEPDAVILDLHFGGQQFEGWRVLHLLRADRDLATLPVVISTAGLSEVEGSEGWLRQHRVWVLTKPFSVTDLESVLASALAKTNGSSVAEGH